MWPWIAWLVIYKTNGAAEQCGGTFISDDWILTAHHCVRHYREIKAYAGKDFNMTTFDLNWYVTTVCVIQSDLK